jgi:DNA processing protein
VEDVLAELDYLDGLRPARIPEKPGANGVEPGLADLTPGERSILGCFAGGGILGPDQVVTQTGLATAEVSAGLMMLELKRRVAKRADGAYEAIG